MFQVLKQAFSDVFQKNIRPLLWETVFCTVLVFCILLFGFSELLSYWQVKDMPWLTHLINVFGYLFFFIMALFMFPVMATFVASFFMDTVIERLEKKSKNARLRAVPLSESLKISGVVAVKGIAVSGFLTPLITLLGLIPVLNLVAPVLFYVLNGRLFAQEYFYAVSTRYTDYPEARKMFSQNRPYWNKAGIIIAFLMTIPVLNMISPLVAVAFMQRLFLAKQHEESLK